jgi:glycosyltransferase involved in cell wall biosynthesis
VSLCVIVPVYNNEESLLELIGELQEIFEQYPESLELRIIFVDDGSTDKSSELILNFPFISRVKVDLIRLSRNFGQLAATVAGLERSDADATIVISADLQEPTKLVADMVKCWESGKKIVVCARQSRSDAIFARFTSRVAYFFLHRENPKLPIGGFDTFLIDALPLRALVSMEGRFRFLQGDIMYLGFPTEILRYHRKKRLHGKSGYSFSARVESFINIWIDSSYSLVRLLTRLGLLIAFSGFLLTTLLLVGWLQNDVPFSGFTLIVCSILIVGGVQILLTGVLGEYIWRQFDMDRKRPLYILESIIELPDGQEQVRNA